MSQTTTAVLESAQRSATPSDTQFQPKLRAVASVASLSAPKGTANDAEIEMTDLAPNASKGVQDVSEPIPWWRPHAQFASLCWAFYVAGWNDGTTGTLLPRIQSHYEVCRVRHGMRRRADNYLGRLHRRVTHIHLELLGANHPMTLVRVSDTTSRVS